MPRKPQGAAAHLTERDLKGHLTTNESNPLTLVGAQNVLRGDPERTIMLLYNLSSAEIYMGFGGTVGGNNGVLIPPSGGFVMINVSEDYELVTLPIWVYSAAAGNQLYIMTTRRDTGMDEAD